MRFTVADGDTFAIAPVQEVRAVLAQEIAYKSVSDSLTHDLILAHDLIALQDRQLVRHRSKSQTDSMALVQHEIIGGLYDREIKTLRRSRWKVFATGSLAGVLLGLVAGVILSP